MWKVILFLSLLLGPFGFFSLSFADTIPALNDPATTKSIDSIGEVFDSWMNASYPNEKSACAARTARYSTTDVKGYSCSPAGRGLLRESATGYGSWTSSLSWSADYFCPAGYKLSADKSTCTMPGSPYCPSGYVLSEDKTTCSNSGPPAEPVCAGVQLANYCASMSGKSVDVSRFADKIAGRSRMCDNVNTQAPGCLMVEGTGCRITSNFPLTGKFSYNGQACARLPNGDPDNTEGAPSPNQCAPGESFGTVNGVTGCFAGGPIQPSDKPPADLSTGKDANGNCAAGYVGRIKNNQLECNPSHVPTDGATCPSGWNAVGVGGKTVCVDPTSGPGGSTDGSGGTGGTGGTPGGGGNNGGNTGGNAGGGKGDASSPGGKPGEGDKPGDKCNYTGMLSFLCDSAPPSFNPDKSGLSGDIGGDLGSMLDTRDFVFGTSSCPPDYFVDYSIGGAAGRLKLTYTPWCTIAQFVRPIVIAIAFVISGFIIFSGRIK